MASSGKKKTTMAKLTRESRLRERRLEKKARKDRRRTAAENPDGSVNPLVDGEAEDGEDPLAGEGRLPVRNSDPVTGRAV
jgi:hypothetical protein